MITVSADAQSHFAKLLSDQDPGTHIRIFVTNPGTPRAECGVAYCPKDDQNEDDHVIEYEAFSAYIDAKSLPFLEDASIDYEMSQMGGQLTLKAPNARAKPVSDDAPLMERVQFLLDSEINPQLANHGGQVGLVEITEDGVAILQFGGGCQGCGMVDVTLKQGIEKNLLEKVPELKGVRDITDHNSGDNPYY
ncbi:MAG: Fe-S biogenesis protein NfuA [Kangiellaceae bacterium]|jgi:Fe/S biogenesis protein NfuA|nr:Fe-S biogenesis protein NfuA [Kangiellaceae bacterium]|tara:strand:- start:843 stop:1418 length:576 start_codon:yes stop_codon:yes gene_type:complete